MTSAADFATLKVQSISRQSGHEFLFGADFPLIPPDKWMAALQGAGFRPEVHRPILRGDATKQPFGER